MQMLSENTDEVSILSYFNEHKNPKKIEYILYNIMKDAFQV